MNPAHAEPRDESGDAKHLLDAIRGDDPTQRNNALDRIRNQLNRFAGGYLGEQGRQADLQPESIVQSVVTDALAEGFDRYADDEHLQNGLKRIVKHKILDRKKKHRPGAMPRGDDDATIDPSAQGPGPGTQVAAREESKIARRRRLAFIDICLAAPLTQRQKDLLALRLSERSWEQIAESLETTVGAAKKMMSEMRPKVLAHVLAPLRATVDGRGWGVIELHFIQRRPLETTASMLGISIESAQHALKRDVEPAIVEHIGREAVVLLQRVLGYTRA